MLELTRGLSPAALGALADLERRTVAVDGGRLKLEWGVLRSRDGRDVEDLLWWEDGRLLGFAGLYAFGPPTVEIAGMVDPGARRHGIATRLLAAALPLCRERELGRVLLVTPRASTPGRQFALRHGATLEHSEHALVLAGPPSDGPGDGPAGPPTSLRAATPADAPELSRLLADAFGEAPADMEERIRSDSARTLVICLDGATVGTVRLTREGDEAGVYGFAVAPAWQGRGIGRDVLRRVCRELRAEGAHRIGLEVAVENDRALGLYTSLGFTRVTTEDYYAVPGAG